MVHALRAHGHAGATAAVEAVEAAEVDDAYPGVGRPEVTHAWV